MFVIDQETGEVFSLAFAKANLVRDRLKANKPAMKDGMVQMSFCNPNTGKCIYRENHTNPDAVFSSGVVVRNTGEPVTTIKGVKKVNPTLEADGDGVKIKVPVTVA